MWLTSCNCRHLGSKNTSVGLEKSESALLYCQVDLHMQGIFSGVFGADLNIENTYLQET